MSVKEYNLKGKDLEAKADIEFNKALPYFEKVYSINPKDKQTQKILLDIYSRLKMTEKMNSLLD